MMKLLDGTNFSHAKSDKGIHHSASNRQPRTLSKAEAIEMLKAVQPEFNDNRRVRSPQLFS
jgi:hypothetical protein